MSRINGYCCIVFRIKPKIYVILSNTANPTLILSCFCRITIFFPFHNMRLNFIIKKIHKFHNKAPFAYNINNHYKQKNTICLSKICYFFELFNTSVIEIPVNALQVYARCAELAKPLSIAALVTLPPELTNLYACSILRIKI